jgi:hypothetical protein
MINIVYICSPFSGDVARNIENARKYCKYAVGKGVMPIAPHLLFPQFLDDNCPVEREKGLTFGLALLEKVDELWVFGSHQSEGMRREIEKANMDGIPIIYIDDIWFM